MVRFLCWAPWQCSQLYSYHTSSASSSGEIPSVSLLFSLLSVHSLFFPIPLYHSRLFLSFQSDVVRVRLTLTVTLTLCFVPVELVGYCSCPNGVVPDQRPCQFSCCVVVSRFLLLLTVFSPEAHAIRAAHISWLGITFVVFNRAIYPLFVILLSVSSLFFFMFPFYLCRVLYSLLCFALSIHICIFLLSSFPQHVFPLCSPCIRPSRDYDCISRDHECVTIGQTNQRQKRDHGEWC